MGKRLRSLAFACVLALGACQASAQEPPLGRQLLDRTDTLWVDPAPVVRTLQWLWDQTTFEYIGCLQGTLSGDTLTIEAVEMADISESDEVSVGGTCRITPQYVGRVHPHKNFFCGPSDVDVLSFDTTKASLLDMIHCERERFWIGSKVPVNVVPYFESPHIAPKP